MQCQPTHFLLCQPQWLTPPPFATGKSLWWTPGTLSWSRELRWLCSTRSCAALLGKGIPWLTRDTCRYCRFHSLVIDVTMALDTLSLPVLEPLTPTRLQDVTVLALSCLYAGEQISCTVCGAFSCSCFCAAFAHLRLSPQVTFIPHEFESCAALPGDWLKNCYSDTEILIRSADVLVSGRKT